MVTTITTKTITKIITIATILIAAKIIISTNNNTITPITTRINVHGPFPPLPSLRGSVVFWEPRFGLKVSPAGQ